MNLFRVLMMAGFVSLCFNVAPSVAQADDSSYQESVEYAVPVYEEQQFQRCDPRSQPYPHWGMKGGQCLKSCGALGGNRSFSDSCARHGMRDMGNAYDVPYCCYDNGRGDDDRDHDRNRCKDRRGRPVPCR